MSQNLTCATYTHYSSIPNPAAARAMELRSHLDFAKALQEEQKRKIHVDMKTVRTGVDHLNCNGIFSGMTTTSLWKEPEANRSQ